MRIPIFVAAFSAAIVPVSVQAESGGANLGSGTFYATVDVAGDLIESRSKGTLPCNQVNETCQISVGRFLVRFARDVTGCAVTATTTGLVPNDPPQASYASVGRPLNDPNGVLVTTFFGNGNTSPSAQHFTVLVTC